MNHLPNNSFASLHGAGRPLGLPDLRLAARWRERRPARSGSAILLILGWTAFGLFQAVPDLLESFSWPGFAGKLIAAWAWALLTPVILLADRTLVSTRQNVLRILAIHLVLSVPFTLAHTYLASLIEYPFPAIWWNPFRSPDYLRFYLLGAWTTYVAFIGGLQAFKFYNRLMISQIALERVEKALVESRLNALRLQLEPHFLFNTLNAISSELATDPVLAREMIEDLGALLRRTLDCHDSTEIPLSQELALLDHYLAIQRLRFGDRIDIRIDVEPTTLSAMVPSLLLQPLIENAIRHGIEGRLSGGMVAVSARRSGDELHIRVEDDGVGLPPDWRIEMSAGLGLRVTRERLEALYPAYGGKHFTIARRQHGGTEVVIRIPLYNAKADRRGNAA